MGFNVPLTTGLSFHDGRLRGCPYESIGHSDLSGWNYRWARHARARRAYCGKCPQSLDQRGFFAVRAGLSGGPRPANYSFASAISV